jgi:tetratricopeptide (TPR) repeat protein
VPTGLHMEYKLPFPRSLFQSGYFGPFLFTVPFSAAVYYVWRRGRSDAMYRTVFFGLAWFLLGLVPYLNILFQLNAPFAEHWLYVPEMGFLLAVCYMLYSVSRSRPSIRVALAGLCAFMIAGYAVMTAKQNTVWKDALTFYTYTLRYAPYSATVHNNIAIEYIRKGDYQKAEAALKRSLELDPAYQTAQANLAKLEQEMRQRGLR